MRISYWSVSWDNNVYVNERKLHLKINIKWD